MGRSWMLALELAVPVKKAWLASRVDPGSYADWPELLQGGMNRATKVSALVALLEKEPLSRVGWDGDTLRATAVVSNGGSFWADGRKLLATAVRSSGGKGELVIANASDNTEAIAVIVTGNAGARVTKGKERAALQTRLRKLEHALGEANAAEQDRVRRTEPLVRDERLRPVHAEILRALRAADGRQVLAAATKLPRTFSLAPQPGAPRRATLATLYTSTETLLVALEHGDPRVYAWCAGQFVAASLEILARVAPETAAQLARDALAAKARHPASKELLEIALGIEEIALGIEGRAAGDDAIAALRRLRKVMPIANVNQQARLRRHPIVAGLAKKKSAKTRDAVLAAILRTLGEPPHWKKVTEKDASFGYVLTHLLEAQKSPTTRSFSGRSGSIPIG